MSEFTDNLHEVFASFGPVTIKRMFGGHGLFHDGLMFGLVADDVLYLKADALTSGDFTTRGLHPIEYQKGSKTVTMSYYAAPEEIFDDSDLALEWAVRAFDAALRGQKPKSKRD